jgi:hypothetical protein
MGHSSAERSACVSGGTGHSVLVFAKVTLQTCCKSYSLIMQYTAGTDQKYCTFCMRPVAL